MSVRRGSGALLDPKQLPTRLGRSRGAIDRLAAAASECLGIPSHTARRLAEQYLALRQIPGEGAFLRWIGARQPS